MAREKSLAIQNAKPTIQIMAPTTATTTTTTTTQSRVRTSFDPEHELPRLHQWFAENPHPSRLTLQVYVKELNSLPSRQSRKLLEVHNLCYWFKNARAAYKRAELRMKRDTPADSTPPQVSISHHQLQQHHKYQQQKSFLTTATTPSHSLRGGLFDSLSSQTSNSSSPSGSPPSSFVLADHNHHNHHQFHHQHHQQHNKHLTAATESLVGFQPAVDLANLKSLVSSTPLVPQNNELDPSQSLYLVLFFMKFFDLDARWRQQIA